MRTDARPVFRLNLVELEPRDVPAWWAVSAPDPAAGMLGDTAATHTGELTFNSPSAAVAGKVTVSAPTAEAAVAAALAGSISVTLSGQTTECTFGPDTVGGSPADQKPFLAVVTGTTVSLLFEDMAGQPGCDYDYNDRAWVE